jgi:hypothetical protein
MSLYYNRVFLAWHIAPKHMIIYAKPVKKRKSTPDRKPDRQKNKRFFSMLTGYGQFAPFWLAAGLQQSFFRLVAGFGSFVAECRENIAGLMQGLQVAA